MGATRRADGALPSDRVDGPFHRRRRRQSLPMRKRIPASTKPKAELVSRKSCLPAVPGPVAIRSQRKAPRLGGRPQSGRGAPSCALRSEGVRAARAFGAPALGHEYGLSSRERPAGRRPSTRGRGCVVRGQC